MADVFVSGTPLIKLALGRGKAAKAQYALQPLEDIVAELKKLPREIALKHQTKALKKAAKPGIDALRNNVAALGQVTGNLLASVTSLDRKYTENKLQVPVSVVVVGFRRPTNSKSQRGTVPAFTGGTVLKGPNRAYHSHLVEFGTRPRSPGKSRSKRRRRVILGGRIRTLRDRVKEEPVGRPILSSFRTRGPWQGAGNYPVNFVSTGTVAGSPARHPLKKAFDQSKQQMQSILDVEMRKALSAAVREAKRKYGDFGL